MTKKIGKAQKRKRQKKLIGFARLRITNPALFKAISSRAGKRAQQLHGKRIRWSKAEARRNAVSGGRAVQRWYRQAGHPLQIAALLREAGTGRAQAQQAQEEKVG